MSISEKFINFLDNLKLTNEDQISLRYGEITAALNKEFRDTESKTNNNLQVGSYGRWTAIKGISDLDMLYIMPASKWDEYNKTGGQSNLLTDTKNAIKNRYPKTEIYVDSPVVRVLYTDFHVEVQPVFEQDDGSFKYPDTRNGGSWKATKPREEIKEISKIDGEKNKNLRRLCKMARAWKNKHGVAMGGLLIDTLANNFLKSTNYYNDKSFLYYDYMSRDFFEYLANEPDKEHYAALGSGQRVKVKSKFQKAAKNAHDLCLKAIEAADTESENKKWQKIYGRPFPAAAIVTKAEAVTVARADNTEQFIEEMFPVDIRHPLQIDCSVSQNGFRETMLREFLQQKLRLKLSKSLNFHVVGHSVPGNYSIYWKVLNRGSEAIRRNCIRGQIRKDQGHLQIEEHTNFHGNHVVECYFVVNDVVVAKDRLEVPVE
ncbi:nucleotidyltransferase [Pseudomonas sp. 2FE]|uniref:SMODS domain-containing nucleotidyltransferase n=1 Tax=Pseudomonas sp. 2FE TaxID=2502190 RepID=UPI0010F52392|nr:nucleotidyltransferase [Pseudomonas sp. 2FE]